MLILVASLIEVGEVGNEVVAALDGVCCVDGELEWWGGWLVIIFVGIITLFIVAVCSFVWWGGHLRRLLLLACSISKELEHLMLLDGIHIGG